MPLCIYGMQIASPCGGTYSFHDSVILLKGQADYLNYFENTP